MLESSVEFLRCIRCDSKLELEIFRCNKEIEEGFLECSNCKLLFPIIDKIPILWDDFSNYLYFRKVLGGKLYQSINSIKLKFFLKDSLSASPKPIDDKTGLETRWSNIYQNSKGSKFYSQIKKNIIDLPRSKLVLEYGCSIGTITSVLADYNDMVFGIDTSFSALSIAKKSSKQNLDYILADSLSPIFGKLQFDLIFALNLLELIEPSDLLNHISQQISHGYFIISDPYDFDRGNNSVRKPLDELTLRANLENLGFKISPKTKNPSFITWNLKLNSRATLNYKVDLVITTK